MTTVDPVDRAVARLSEAEATVVKCKAELATAELNLAAVKNASTPELLDDHAKADDVANARLLASAAVETSQDMLAASELDRENAAQSLADARADRIHAQDLPQARAALEAWEAKETELLEQLMAHGGTHPDDLPNATRTIERLRGLWREACLPGERLELADHVEGLLETLPPDPNSRLDEMTRIRLEAYALGLRGITEIS